MQYVHRHVLLASAFLFGRAATSQSPDRSVSLPVLEARRISAVGGDSLVFGYVTNVVPLSDSRLLVGEWRPPTLSIISADGRRSTNVGGIGEGPGEFRALGAISAGDGTIWAVDPSLRRVLQYGQNGRALRTAANVSRERAGAGTLVPLGAFSDGRVMLSPAVGADDRGRLTTDGAEIGVLDADLRSYRVLTRAFGRPLVRVTVRGAQVTLDNPLAPPRRITAFSWNAGRIFEAEAVQDEGTRMTVLTVRAIRVDSSQAWSTRLSLRCERLESSYVEATADSLALLLGDPTVGSTILSQLRSSNSSTCPGEAVAGYDGSVWIGRNDRTGTKEWYVLDPNGTLRGRITGFQRGRLLGVTVNRAWVAESEDDTPRIVEYSVEVVRSRRPR